MYRIGRLIGLGIVLPLMYASAQDTLVPNKVTAYEQLTALKHGALIVRLKTNDRSVEAYAKAGKTEIADRIVEERRVQNQKIVDAFRTSFDFCKVYFIYSRNTDNILKGENGFFLNDTLGTDTTIRLSEAFYLFAEYGMVNSNMRQDEYHYKNVNKTEATSNPATSSAIFISDTTLTQLKEPFPFYTVVLLDNYRKAIDRLNAGLYRVYYRWTVKQAPDAGKKNNPKHAP